jgi:hypothetical protein
MFHGNRTRQSRLCKPLQSRCSCSREAQSLPGEDEIAPLASERTPPFRRFAMTRGQLTRYDARAVPLLSEYLSLRNGRWICSWAEPTPTHPAPPCPSSPALNRSHPGDEFHITVHNGQKPLVLSARLEMRAPPRCRSRASDRETAGNTGPASRSRPAGSSSSAAARAMAGRRWASRHQRGTRTIASPFLGDCPDN